MKEIATYPEVPEDADLPDPPAIHSVTAPVVEYGLFPTEGKPDSKRGRMHMTMPGFTLTTEDGEVFECLTTISGSELIIRREGWADVAVNLTGVAREVVEWLLKHQVA